MKFDLHHEEKATGQQDVHYCGFYKATANGTAHKLRVQVRRDSYDFQSWATVEVWSNALSRWENIGSIHYSRMKTRRDYVSGKWEIANYGPDVDSLLHTAEVVLSN